MPVGTREVGQSSEEWCAWLLDSFELEEAEIRAIVQRDVLPLIEIRARQIIQSCPLNHVWRAKKVLHKRGLVRKDPSYACELLAQVNDLSCDSAFIERSHRELFPMENEMACTITPSSVITREGNLWVIDGKTKVSDLSQCKTLKVKGSPEPEPAPSIPEPVVQPPVIVQQVPQQVQHTPMVQQPTQDGLELDLVQVVKLAGDNVWLAAVLVAAVLAKKYIDKLDLSKATQEQLNSSCHQRHQEALTHVTSVSQGMDTLSKEGKEADTKVRADLEKMMGDLEKRVLAVEMELKYQKPAPAVGRPKKTTEAD